MKRVLVAWLAGMCATLASGAGTASAQYIPPSRPNYGVGYQPLLDPAINMLRPQLQQLNPGINDITIDYFLGTQPEVQRRSQYIENRQEILGLERSLGRGAAAGADETDLLLTPLPSTGHATAFNNLGGYFNSNRLGNSATIRRPQQQQQRPAPPMRP